MNLEPLPQGGFKPKIPLKLLMDKKRTQSRFRVMRQKDAQDKKCKDRRSTSIMTRKINNMLKVN